MRREAKERDESKAGGTPENAMAAGSEPLDLDPLAFMLQVMNDPTADKDRRDRVATTAAPFVLTRKA